MHEHDWDCSHGQSKSNQPESKYDEYPESCFLYVGTIEEVEEKYKKMMENN